MIGAKWVLAGIAAALCACSEQKPLDDDATVLHPGDSMNTVRVSRWRDPEYRVTCWVTGSNAISCLPDQSTAHRSGMPHE